MCDLKKHTYGGGLVLKRQEVVEVKDLTLEEHQCRGFGSNPNRYKSTINLGYKFKYE